MKEMELKVEGMHCTGCENRIKNSLKLINGVKEVEANHEKGTVKVIVENEEIIGSIKEEIIDLGFDVKE